MSGSLAGSSGPAGAAGVLAGAVHGSAPEPGVLAPAVAIVAVDGAPLVALAAFVALDAVVAFAAAGVHGGFDDAVPEDAVCADVSAVWAALVGLLPACLRRDRPLLMSLLSAESAAEGLKGFFCAAAGGQGGGVAPLAGC